MRAISSRALVAVAALALSLGASGCGLHSQLAGSSSTRTSTSSPANEGEGQGVVPPSAQAQAGPLHPSSTPQGAIAAFASLYVNWSYRTLAHNERTLAAMAVGDARSQELQAAAQSQADTAIARGHLYNSGKVVAIGQQLGGGEDDYVVVTEEHTGGNALYAGLSAGYHVTFAEVQQVQGRYAISRWAPAS